MEVLNGDMIFAIDVEDIKDKIDNIIHKEITNKTGITFDHYYIRDFISLPIRENNKKERKMIADEKLRQELFDLKQKQRDDKIKNNKFVINLDSFLNRFKFHCLGYIVIQENEGSDE